jgi:hypothetical protein
MIVAWFFYTAIVFIKNGNYDNFYAIEMNNYAFIIYNT